MEPKQLEEKIGKEIILDWYDGPVLSVAGVICKYPDEPEKYRFVQVRARGQAFDDDEEIELPDHADVVFRFNRGELVQMLNLIDGKGVKDCFNKDHTIDSTMEGK